MVQKTELLRAQLLMISKLFLESISLAFQFEEMYEVRNVIFSVAARSRLQEMVGDDLNAWIEQQQLIAQQQDQTVNQECYGFVQIQYDDQFKQQSEEAFASLRTFINGKISGILVEKLQKIEETQNKVLVLIADQSEAKLQ